MTVLYECPGVKILRPEHGQTVQVHQLPSFKTERCVEWDRVGPNEEYNVRLYWDGTIEVTEWWYEEGTEPFLDEWKARVLEDTSGLDLVLYLT